MRADADAPADSDADNCLQPRLRVFSWRKVGIGAGLAYCSHIAQP